METQKVKYKTAKVNDLDIFYREAGDPTASTILLLHGFPTSSHMFRELIPLLSEKFHIIAPDLPGFGLSSTPDHTQFNYTFDNLAKAMNQFTEKIGLEKYAMYVFDYGAPVGYRLALAHPEKITAIISQNGNAYLEGLSNGWNPIQNYWQTPTLENRNSLYGFLQLESTKFQYLHGVPDESLVSPDGYMYDQLLLDREGNNEIQLDLMGDYKNNVAMYPEFQEYFRTYKPALLAVWGENDPFFLPVGAESYKKDLPNAIVKFYNTGHFALETHVHAIADDIIGFLS
jgi:pimeloyl-ACP methyl ester carboxylesterase